MHHIIHGNFHRQQIRHNLAVTLVGALSAPLQKSVFTSLDIPFIVACLKNAALVTQGLHVADIVLPVGGTQGIDAQTFASFAQTGGCRFWGDDAGLEEFNPFVQRCRSHLVEIVDAQHVVFGEKVASFLAFEDVIL